MIATQHETFQDFLPGIQPLEKISSLIERSDYYNCAYCHWKTNLHLDKALAGIDDLDLLVASDDFPTFNIALLQEEFREAESITSKFQQGIYHFLANDAQTGRLINAHVHTHTMTGDHFIKSWALPFEEMLLENTDTISGMPVPTRAAELIIYVIRSMIKHASLFDLPLIIKSGKSTTAEYDYLTENSNIILAQSLLQKHIPEIDPETFSTAIRLLGTKSSLLDKIRLGYSFKRKLKKYRRYNAFVQTAITSYAVLRMSYNRIIHHHKHMTLRNGGSIIALVGPQATGKSTIAAELRKWLGVELAVTTIHSGKPPRTLMTLLPSLAIPLARKLMPGKATVLIEKDAIDNDSRSFPLIFIIRKVMLAWDRRAQLGKAWKNARNGKIIISDRYPSDLVGAIDGATFRDEAIAAEPSPVKRFLMKIERRIYSDICPPDLVLELTVSTEKAIERNLRRNKKGPKQTTDYVKLRHAMKYKPAFYKTPVVSISTDEDFDTMMLHIKKVVWAAL